MGKRSFRFAAQPRLDLATEIRRQRQLDLAQAEQARANEERALDAIAKEIADLTQQIVTGHDDLVEPRAGQVNPEQRLWDARRLEALRRACRAREVARAEQSARVEHAVVVVDEARRVLAAIDSEVRSLERLRARQHEDWRRAIARAEEKELSEAGLQCWIRDHAHAVPEIAAS